MNIVVDHVTKTIHGAVVLQDILKAEKSTDCKGKMDRVKRCFYV